MSSTVTTPALFRPFQLTPHISLKHRVALAPLTRLRASSSSVPLQPIVKVYYAQRASTPGTLLIAEGTIVAPQAGGWGHAPGIWSAEQIDAWKEITDAVHAKGSFIFLQIFAGGRASDPAVLDHEAGGPFPYIGASTIPLSDRLDQPPPRALTIVEINEYVKLFAVAASNAVYKAGFDGVEVHGANGYLIDQFIQDHSNDRTDAYGGSIENRARFALEVLEAVVGVVGEEKTALRLSPWSTFQDMRMADPIPTFSYLTSTVKERYPRFAYLHVIEPRVNGASDSTDIPSEASNAFLADIWEPKSYLTAGGFNRQLAIEAAEERKNALVAFGRHFLANPDLPTRLRRDQALNASDRSSFYLPGDASGRGYTDYPFVGEAWPLI